MSYNKVKINQNNYFSMSYNHIKRNAASNTGEKSIGKVLNL